MPRNRDWGESSALLLSLLLFGTLRDRYTLGSPALTLVFAFLIGAVCLISLFATIADKRKKTRWVMIVAAVVLAISVALSLLKVVYLVVYQAHSVDGIRLLQTSLLIWFNNVIVFAIIYHLIGERDFVFPRSEEQPPNQPMNFLDYVFLSFTTATAFSPTDTSPLSTQARMC